MSSLNLRHLVVIGAALVAVAVLAVVVTLLATGDGAQPDRERTVTVTSSELTFGPEGICKAALERFNFRDQFGDAALSHEAIWITPSSCVLGRTAHALPGLIMPGQTVAELAERPVHQ